MKKTALSFLFLVAGSGWATPDNAEMRNRAVTQAQEVLSVRQSLLTHIQSRYPQIKIDQRPGALSFFIPPSLLFDNEGTVCPRPEKWSWVFCAIWQPPTVRCM
ncbi:MAG: hypothetical protein IPN90_11170 [Elusimicrobia bacterium]|nr:hypothetical protein [Elusimicrobiota bacterium]